MNKFYYSLLDTPIGPLTIQNNGTAVTRIEFAGGAVEGEKELTEIGALAEKQMEEYFRGRRKIFDLPIFYRGTPFQNSVWDALCRIPYGEVRSYKDIAEEVNCPNGFRAVGGANHANPIPIIVPCHRVVTAGGRLGGFGGGLTVKVRLLELEGISDYSHL